jgi:hypothetical protein
VQEEMTLPGTHGFCHLINQDQWLSSIIDPLPLLQIFTHQYCFALLSISSLQVSGLLQIVKQLQHMRADLSPLQIFK